MNPSCESDPEEINRKTLAKVEMNQNKIQDKIKGTLLKTGYEKKKTKNPKIIMLMFWDPTLLFKLPIKSNIRRKKY